MKTLPFDHNGVDYEARLFSAAIGQASGARRVRAAVFRGALQCSDWVEADPSGMAAAETDGQSDALETFLLRRAVESFKSGAALRTPTSQVRH